MFLDVDNTIKRYSEDVLHKGVHSWLELMNKNGIKIILCSNNYKRNVEPFAKKLGLDYVHMCLKPSPFGYIRALHKTRSSPKQVLVCGDQIFTDILGANLTFLKSALIEPIDTSNEADTVKLRRRIFKNAHKRNMERKNPF